MLPAARGMEERPWPSRPWIYAAALWTVLLLPGPGALPLETISGFDKAMHALLFVPFGFLLAREQPRAVRSWSPRVLLVLVGFAAATELSQHLVPWRTADPADLAADLGGGLLGLGWGLFRSLR